jgi:transcriptional regulator with XRE-family HTH domain
MTETLVLLGLRIRDYRKNLGISQEEFADLCGFDRTYVSLVERGKRNMSFSNLTRIASGLGVSVSKLTEGIENGTYPD